MLLEDILSPCPDCYERIYVDDEGNIIEEAAIRQLKRYGSVIKKQYRCTSGPKKGKIVASSQACGRRKEPKRVRLGRKSARLKKGLRVLKTRIRKRQQTSKMVSRVNRRLAGK
jgi:hypothetical protein